MPTLSNTDEFDFETREVDHFLLFVPFQDMRSESSGFHDAGFGCVDRGHGFALSLASFRR